jgi:hypothetical protein
MATLISIANLALTYLGHNTINSLDQANEAARKSKLLMQPAIDATLRGYNWNCATDRAALALSAEAPVFNFAYKFVLPNDCLRVIQMEEISFKFKIEGRFLVTNESTANILYIKRILVGEMDSLLIQAVAAKLALDMSFPLTNSTSLMDSMAKLYSIKITEAQQIDAQEGTPDDLVVDDWLDARR